MRMLVLGAGAVGGYFGGRLAEAGGDVTFLVRERRREQLSRDGLRIESRLGDLAMPVRTVLAGDLRPEFDCVLLTCKAYDLDSSIAAIGPGLAPSGFVLPLLNGLSHMDALNAAFGRERVLGGVARIGSTLTPDGVIKHLIDWHSIVFGEQDGGMSGRVETLKAAYEGAKGVQAVAVPDIMQQMWDKIVPLSAGGAMTCLMRANAGEINRTPDGTRLFLSMLDTMAEIAKRAGFTPSEAMIASQRKSFSDKSSPFQTSMARDIEAGNKIEADHIVGYMLARARELGVEDGLLTVAYTHLKAYEERRAAGRP